MAQVIVVEPLGEGWTVKSSQIDNDMPFRSGAAAELAARDLAQRLNAAGLDAEIRILLRDGSLAARFVCPVADGAEPGASGQSLAGAA